MSFEEKFLEIYRVAVDEACENVMPDSLHGHARLAIRKSDAVPSSIENEAIAKASSIADNTGVSPERAANKLISKIAEKRDN